MDIDLNADLGEGVGDEAALLRIVTSANIATGAHAGGGAVLRTAVAGAVAHGLSVGAHPSYRDRVGFGRRSGLDQVRGTPAARASLRRDLAEQCLVVAAEVERRGVPLAHVKAHGALYNEAVVDEVAAQLVADAVVEVGRRCGYPVAVMTQPGGVLARLAASLGIEVLAEGFADRQYLPSGRLVPRGDRRALHVDAAAMVGQARDLAAGRVRAIDGSAVELVVQSVCVHGDTPAAVSIAQSVRGALEDDGWRVGPPVLPAAGYRRLAERLVQMRGAAADPVGDAPGVHPFGDRGLLVQPAPLELPTTSWALVVARVARRVWPHATVLPGLASVLVAFDEPLGRGAGDAADLLAAAVRAGLAAQAWEPGDPDAGAGGPGSRTHSIPVRYDGPDLAQVAASLGIPTGEVVARHRAALWRVAAIGFSPGFGYLTSSDPIFSEVPRRSDPRSRVPAGAVALAAGMCAVYPSASPGGWHLIGSTQTPLFDAGAQRPARLRVGDRVAFRAVE